MASQEQIGSRIKPHVTVPRSLLTSTMHAMHMASPREHTKLPLYGFNRRPLGQACVVPSRCCPERPEEYSELLMGTMDIHGPSPPKLRRFQGMDTQFGSIWGL